MSFNWDLSAFFSHDRSRITSFFGGRPQRSSAIPITLYEGGMEPGGLPSMGSHRVGHDWSDLAAAAAINMPSTWPCCQHDSLVETDLNQTRCASGFPTVKVTLSFLLSILNSLEGSHKSHLRSGNYATFTKGMLSTQIIWNCSTWDICLLSPVHLFHNLCVTMDWWAFILYFML